MLSSSTGITVPTIFGSIALTPREQRADERATPGLAMWKVFADRMREVGHRHRLQPHASGSSQRREKDAVAAKQRVLDAGHGGDVELHALLVHADMPGVNTQRVARLQVVRDDLAVELYPGLALSLKALHAKAGAAEDAGAEPLLET